MCVVAQTVNIIAMLFLEAFIKFVSIGLLIALGALVVRDGRGSKALRFSVPCIAAVCFMLMTTGSSEIALTGPIAIPLRLFDSLIAIFIWLLGLTLFDDDFELGKREWGVIVLYIATMIPLRLYYMGFDVYWDYSMNIFVSGFSITLMAHLCYKALIGRNEDLVEQRRRMRVWIVVAVAMTAIASNLAEKLADWFGVYEMATFWITYTFTMPISLWALLWLARLHPEVLAFDSKEAKNKGVIAIEDRDKAVYRRLVEIMETEKAYTNHGMAIGELAEQVGVPPHQLRKLINQTMGYRNFSSFLNKYRIAAVKKALSDPDNARTPVLTLAIEAGYSSLAPFNRAFKVSQGVTPTDFRAQSLAENNANDVQN